MDASRGGKLHLRTDVGRELHPFRIEIDHLIECLEPSVVHVGASQVDVAKRWGAVGPDVGRIAGKVKTVACIVVHSRKIGLLAIVEKLVAGQQDPSMAVGAICLLLEDDPTLVLFVGQLLLSPAVPVELAVGGDQGPDKLGNGLFDVFHRDYPGAKCLPEEFGVAFDPLDHLYCASTVSVQFVRGDHPHVNDVLQGSPFGIRIAWVNHPVPEIAIGIEHQVDEGKHHVRGFDACQTKRVAILEDGMVDAAFEGVALQVAGAAAHQRVGLGTARHPSVVEEVSAQCDSLCRELIVDRNI